VQKRGVVTVGLNGGHIGVQFGGENSSPRATRYQLPVHSTDSIDKETAKGLPRMTLRDGRVNALDTWSQTAARSRQWGGILLGFSKCSLFSTDPRYSRHTHWPQGGPFDGLGPPSCSCHPLACDYGIQTDTDRPDASLPNLLYISTNGSQWRSQAHGQIAIKRLLTPYHA